MLKKNLLTAFVLLGMVPLARAGILGMSDLKIDFTKPATATEKATWSDPQHLGCTEQGFGWDGDAKSSRDGWIETTPVSIGVSWRPTSAAHIRVKLQTNYPPIEATGPNSKAFYVPSIYVRHSPDREHWSDWQPLDISEDAGQPGTVLFTTRLGVPRRDSSDYYDRLRIWSRRDDVGWASDEEAFCTWLVEQDPEYFEKHRPFVGHVQFLMEDSFRGGQRLKSFDAEISWAVSGIHTLPKDPPAERKHFEGEGGDSGWRFPHTKK